MQVVDIYVNIDTPRGCITLSRQCVTLKSTLGVRDGCIYQVFMYGFII